MNKNDYPEVKKYIFNNRHIIRNELFNVIKTDNWSRWIEYDNINESPIFSKMSGDEILKHMDKTKCKIGDGKNSWKIFGLYLQKKPIEKNRILCPKTMQFLDKIPGIINAGFSCLEPNVKTSLHKGYNDKIVRVHIPMIIPKGDTAIKINNTIIQWSENDFFIFDDTFYHQAWNNTKKYRIVLLIDILK